jgi:peptidoglycan/xylan/chitin deacetylase (PgdA/CDA1 family)
MNKKLLISKWFNNSILKSLRLKKLHKSGPTIKIINFHRVLSNDVEDKDYRKLANHPTEAQFENIIKHISENYNPICLREFNESGFDILSDSKLNVAITFDDGYKDNIENGYPILEKYNVPATIFCTTNTLDGNKLWFQDLYTKIDNLEQKEISFDWYPTPILLENKWVAMEAIANSCKSLNYEETLMRIASIPTVSNKEDTEVMLEWNDLHELRDSPLITIGAHTCKHWNLTTLSEDELLYELITPHQKLKSFMGYKQLMIAYPNGRFDENVLSAVQDSGYSSGYIMTRGVNTNETSKYAFHRQYVETNPYLFDFQMYEFDLMFRRKK